MSVVSDDNPVIAVIPEKIRTISQLVYWIPNQGSGVRLYDYSEINYGHCPLERFWISRSIGLPASTNHEVSVLELVKITTNIAQSNPNEIRNISNPYEHRIMREFLYELNRWYSHVQEVKQMFRIPVLQNLIEIQN